MWIITKAKYAKMETFDFKINKIFFIFWGFRREIGDQTFGSSSLNWVDKGSNNRFTLTS